MNGLSIRLKRSRLPYYIATGIVVLFILPLVVLYKTHDFASATAPKGWNAGYIIDDSVFTAYSSMSASSIQNFLNNKVPSCDTYGQQLSEYGGPDLNGDGKVQRWEWGKAYYNQTKFVCLKDYVENNTKASQIIYNISQKYKINPKVLLVLLQKEQGLVTDTWPLNVQYRSATGYGCPDTSACDSQYYGLTNQLDWAAKMYRAIMDDNPNWYTPYVLGKNYIQYNPDSRCSGSTVNIENRATQALYNYTPYQPNSYALNGGTVSTYSSCGAFGNRNFFTYFSNWFGQPNASATYGFSLVSQNLYSDSTYTTAMGTNSATIKPGSTFYVKVLVKNTGNQTWYNDFLRLGTANPQDRTSVFSDASWIAGNRPAAMLESSVPSGGTATFEFKAVAPSSLGLYPESFGVLLEGQRWLSGSLAFNLTVASPDPVYAAQNVAFDIYKDSARTVKLDPTSVSLYTGSRIYVTAKIKNTGNRDFPADITKLATSNPHDRVSVFSDSSWLSANRVTTAVEGAITPGQTGTYNFTMTAPSSAGSFPEQFGLVIEDQRWVSDNVGSTNITVATRPPSSIQTGIDLKVGQILLSGNELYKLVMQSDGNLVLYTSAGKALWNTKTSHTAADKLVMQSDGNLVLYTSAGKALWNTKTSQ